MMHLNLERLEELFAQIRERVKTAIANGVEVGFSDECGIRFKPPKVGSNIRGCEPDGSFQTVITIGEINPYKMCDMNGAAKNFFERRITPDGQYIVPDDEPEADAPTVVDG